MQKVKHDWERFWCSRDSNYTLDPDGYLADPSEYAVARINANIMPTQDLVNIPGLVMLGEPGIGKTAELDILRAATLNKVAGTSDKVHHVDLRSVNSEQRLVAKIFESTEFKEWMTGTYTLHLFLDSLDECMLRVATVAAILVDELHAPVERLRLRIACRTAVWPSLLETALLELWGDEEVGIYELLPLRSSDVTLAASDLDVDPEQFLATIRASRAVPFAIKPVTLDFLVRTYVRDNSLPESQFELYKEGCRILCEEVSKSRLAGQTPATLTCDQRLAIASRLAAVSMFGNQIAIYTGPDVGGLRDQVLPIRMASGGGEPVGNNEVLVSVEAIRETIDTGLFTARDQELMGFAHQTYAEFLAAYWVCQNELSLSQIRLIIDHPSARGDRIIPQLHETAAWIATQRSEVLDHLIEVEPHVLLRSDVAAMDTTAHERIVTHLLSCFEYGNLSPFDILRAYPTSGLRYPTLPQQLRTYIRDATKSESARWAAIWIATDCTMTELQEDLVTVALDVSAPYIVRTIAARGVGRIGDLACKARLLPLVSTNENEDPDDQLRGYALEALWPDCISPEELFSHLTQPYHPNHHGSYMSFLYYGIVAHLKLAELTIALEWVKSVAKPFQDLNPLSTPSGAIMRMAWDHIDCSEVLTALAGVVYSRIEQHVSPFDCGRWPLHDDAFRLDTESRRKLIERLVWLTAYDDTRFRYIEFSDSLVSVHEDLSWLLDNAMAAEDTTLRQAYARLARNAADPQLSDDISMIMQSCDSCKEMRELCGGCFDPVRLDSSEAAIMKADYEKYNRIRERNSTKPPLLDPPPNVRIESDLTASEDGDIDAWAKVYADLNLTDESAHEGVDPRATVSSLYCWQNADLETRARIIASAERFVERGPINDTEWETSDVVTFHQVAGYHAIAFLHSLQPHPLHLTLRVTWEKWARTIVMFPFIEEDEESPTNDILTVAYQNAPREFTGAILLKIDRENAKDQTVFALRHIKPCWDAELGEAILAKIDDPKLHPNSVQQLFSSLLGLAGVELSQIVARTCSRAEMMVSEYASTGAGRERALAAAVALMESHTGGCWSTAGPILHSDIGFGRDLLEKFAHPFGACGGLLKSLAEDDLADLYTWMEAEYPHAADPNHKEMMAHFVGHDESVRSMRDDVLVELRQRGTPEACTAIEGLATALPQLPWLNNVLAEARSLTLTKTWKPMAPDRILEIGQRARINRQLAREALAKEPTMKIRVLFVTANPGVPKLAIDEEIRGIMEKIRASEYRDAIDVVQSWATRPSDLMQALNEHKPHVVHFSSHGSPTSEIILQDDAGAERPVTKDAMKALFEALEDNVKVVVFNACYSREQAEAVTGVIDVAIGMNDTIGDDAAIKFSATFYSAIGFGLSIQKAFDQGIALLKMEGIAEDHVPELLAKIGVDASNVTLICERIDRI